VKFHTKAGYRSGLEEKNAARIANAGFTSAYEEHSLKYNVPSRIARYTPDFPMLHNGVIVETKGMFVTADRQKHILIKNDHPDLDVRFVFSNPNSRISKTSSTSYAMWCEKHGFVFAKGLIPTAWLREPPEPKRMAAMWKALGIKPLSLP
jgi:hypothetical protein